MTRTIRSLAVGMAFLIAGGVILSLTAQKAISQIRAALIKNVDQPGRLPYQNEVDFPNSSCTSGNSFCVVAFPAVPAGKRLVVEEVTALAFVRNGGQVDLLAFGSGATTNTGNVAILQPTFTPLFVADAFEVAWSIDKQVRVYYEPGTTPSVKIQASVGFGALGSNMTLHGYLIDATN